MSQEQQHQWSDSLRDQTRKALADMPVVPGGRISMKHIGRGYGFFDLAELVAGKFLLHLRDGAGELTFADAEAVIAAGWAID